VRIVYQPCVNGEDCLGYRATRFSRRVYTSHRAAKAAIPDFLERLKRQHEHDMGYLETVVDVKIIPLELVEEPHERVRVSLPG